MEVQRLEGLRSEALTKPPTHKKVGHLNIRIFTRLAALNEYNYLALNQSDDIATPSSFIQRPTPYGSRIM